MIFSRFFSRLILQARRDDMGLLGMKPMGDHILLNSKTVSAVECLHYAMNLPVNVGITGIDLLEISDQDLNAARTFRPLSGQELSALLSKTKKTAENGRSDLYKTLEHFDTTAKHPEWLE